MEPSLNSPSTAALRAAVSELVPSWNAEALSDFELLPWGFSNHNFRFSHAGERFALRVPTRTHAFVDRELEWDFYRSNTRVRTVEVIAFDVRSGTMISRWQSAPLLADHPAASADLLSYLRGLQDNLPGCRRAYDPLELSRGYLAVGRPHAEVSRRLAVLRWAPAALATCHNDLNPWNVLRDDSGGWITLDWEWYGLNDPLFDLVTLHQGLALELATLTPLAEEFLGEAGIEARLTICLTGFWLREYAWAHGELSSGNVREEIEAQRDLALERLRSL